MSEASPCLRDFFEAIIGPCRWFPDPRGELSRLAMQLRQGFRREDIGRAVREAVRRLGLDDAFTNGSTQ